MADNFTEKELLALRAVAYGCNTNRKIAKGENGTYCLFDKDMKEIASMPFVEALEIVYEIIEKEDKKNVDRRTSETN